MDTGFTMVTDESFATFVAGSQGPTVLYCCVVWSEPCRDQAVIVEQVIAEYAGQVQFGSLDCDLAPATVAEFSIRIYPTFLFFKNGMVVDTLVGAVPQGALVDRIREML